MGNYRVLFDNERDAFENGEYEWVEADNKEQAIEKAKIERRKKGMHDNYHHGIYKRV